ncbi:MAG: DNA repair protein RadC [Treponema sp.]|nr:DNA repair protein RadC [Treponema sp.]MBQ7618512.1 DNA repair protein RadC [Treponema sp.]MBQ9625597.1 DNA repair protein RadC [Treponema sp.]
MGKQKLDLRERVFARGMSYPSDAELLMLILGSGTKALPVEEIAYKMVDAIDVSDPRSLVDNLLRIPGVGMGKALAVAAALEFGRRKAANLNAVIDKPADLLPFIQQYAYKSSEHFITVSLSGAREIISQKVVAVGNSNSAIINPREVLFEAVQRRASAVILSHNHPSGNVQPSDDDIETTKRLCSAAEILGISVLDHIIVSRREYFSFKERGLLKEGA